MHFDVRPVRADWIEFYTNGVLQTVAHSVEAATAILAGRGLTIEQCRTMLTPEEKKAEPVAVFLPATVALPADLKSAQASAASAASVLAPSNPPA